MLQQQLQDIGSVRSRRRHESRSADGVVSVNIRFRVQEQAHNLPRTVLASPDQDRCASAIGGIGICAGSQNHLNNFGVNAFTLFDQSNERWTILRSHIRIGMMFNQTRDDAAKACRGAGVGEQSSTVLIGPIWIRALIQQIVYNFGMLNAR